MKKYELTLVLTEEAGKDDKTGKKYASELLSSAQGVIKEEKFLGVRPLAYNIAKQSRGWYGVFTVELDGNKIPELEKKFRQDEKILRHLLIRAESHVAKAMGDRK